MIFYFSATGNSQYIAQRLAEVTGETLVSITECLKNHKYTWQTESQKIESSLEEQITLRENNHRFVIPRADGLFGNRARGKVMICSIEDVKPNPAMAIQYIITKYRQSWS